MYMYAYVSVKCIQTDSVEYMGYGSKLPYEVEWTPGSYRIVVLRRLSIVS